MANNTQVNTGSGDFIRTIDRAGVKSDVAIIDRGGSASEDLGPLYGDTASGNIAGLTSVSIAKPFGFCTVGVQVTGTFVATLVFEGSADGTNFVSLSAVPSGGTGIPVTQATTPGIWQTDVTGLSTFRVRCTAFTSGTAVITLISSVGDGGGRLTGALPPGNNLIGYSGQQPTFGAAQTATITIASVAHGALSTSSNIDNSVTRYALVKVQLKVRTGLTTFQNGTVDVYVARSIDAGATFDGSGGGASPIGATLLGSIPTNTPSFSYASTWEIPSPGPMYRIILVNNTGAALDATAGNHSLKYIGIN
jgi:hypothetical protein